MTQPLVLSKGHTVHVRGISTEWRVLAIHPRLIEVESTLGVKSCCPLAFLRQGIQDGTITIERGES